MKKAEKPLYVANLAEELKAAKAVILVNFTGLGVKAQQELKRRLREAGAKILVVKNTLLKRAGETAKIDKEVLTDTVLTGQTALIISEDDPVAPIQVLGKFAKEFNSGAGYSVPQFKVGIIEGSFQDRDALVKLSTLPGRDALLGQLLSTLMSPAYGLVGTLSGNMQNLVYVLKEVSNRG